MVMPVLLDEVLEIQGIAARQRRLNIAVELMQKNGVSVHGNPTASGAK
jgi:predicted HTH domain antitoxin